MVLGVGFFLLLLQKYQFIVDLTVEEREKEGVLTTWRECFRKFNIHKRTKKNEKHSRKVHDLLTPPPPVEIMDPCSTRIYIT